MKSIITKVEEGKQKIEIDFSDENVDVQAETTVLGSEADAQRYKNTFGNDIKRQNRHKFPQPEPTPPEELELEA